METAREARYVLLLDDRVRLYGRVTECAYDLCIVSPFGSLFLWPPHSLAPSLTQLWSRVMLGRWGDGSCAPLFGWGCLW